MGGWAWGGRHEGRQEAGARQACPAERVQTGWTATVFSTARASPAAALPHLLLVLQRQRLQRHGVLLRRSRSGGRRALALRAQGCLVLLHEGQQLLLVPLLDLRGAGGCAGGWRK